MSGINDLDRRLEDLERRFVTLEHDRDEAVRAATAASALLEQQAAQIAELETANNQLVEAKLELEARLTKRIEYLEDKLIVINEFLEPEGRESEDVS